MSLDMTTVTGITVPEGTVVQIKDSNDNVLWQIPYRYRKLQYIESGPSTSKGQYCIRLSEGGRYYEVDYALSTTTWNNTGSGQFWGGLIATNDGNDSRGGYVESSSKVTWAFAGSSKTTVSSDLANTNRHTVYVKPISAAGYNYTRLAIDGTGTNSIKATWSGMQNSGLYSLFAQKYDNSEWSIYAKLYSFTALQADNPATTGTYTCHYYPAQDKITGKVGVYCEETNTFYSNVNTNYNFTAGPTVTED